MIQTKTGLLCVAPHTVTNVRFTGDSIGRQFTAETRKTELNVRLGKAAAGQTLTVTYLAKGITWAPSYMVDISDEQTAQLSAKAVIINDACRLNNADVQLVTGFPHLQFSRVISPMGNPGNLHSFLQMLTQRDQSRNRPSVLDNVMYQNVAYASPATDAAPEYGDAQVGVAAEDLFLYPAGSIDLGRDEVAYIPLFTEAVPYEHVYQWDIPDYVNEQNRYSHNRNGREDLAAEEEIWHSLRMTNRTEVPWTTAPGQTVKNGVILGQDTLKYTPLRGETTLRITRAIGVKGDQIELETARERDALYWHGSHYDLVTIKGELSVVNTLSKAITLEITKIFSGEAQSIEPDAKQEKLARGLRRVNPRTKLTWTIELPNGARRKLAYEYNVYIR